MKKALVLIVAMILTLSMASGALAAEIAPTILETNALIVGSLTRMSGDFFTDRWGNNTADMDVRGIIHGYSTVSWGESGNFAVDPTVVVDAQATDDPAGNRTYRFTLAQDLTYNNGLAITAKDYLFTVLLLSSPQFEALGVVPTSKEHLVGYQSFLNGGPFTGLRLYNDYEFSVTIAAEYLPYYYELIMVDTNPYPLSVIAPGCDIVDDGNGATIEGPFTTELLRETILDEETGYRFHPAVTSGPYTLDEYDSETHIASFSANKLFKGDAEGRKPSIQSVTFRQVEQETMLEELVNGTVNLLNKISEFEAIATANTLRSQRLASAVTYPRTGLAFLSFACEMGPTQSPAVRRAISMCMDRWSIVNEYIPGLGMPVYGHYGLGQAMGQEHMDTLMEEPNYDFDLNSARLALEQGGWNLNAEGELFDNVDDTVRYRRNEAGALEELRLQYVRAQNNRLADIVEEMLTENLPKIGIAVEVTTLPFTELLENYYRHTDRAYHVYGLATNFDRVYDPYYTFNTEDMYQGEFNATGIRDAKLEQLTQDMRDTPAGDYETYSAKWLAFQQYFAEVMPLAPLYSNVYADIFTPFLINYAPNAYWGWGSALLSAYIGVPEEADTTEGTSLFLSAPGDL